ncbi:MAG: cyclase family protein [Terriglobales bacterium]|jgi:kynurenine formamidase
MKVRTFAVALALALAVFLFAQRHASAPEPPAFAHVVDLTHTVSSGSPGYEVAEKFSARTVATIEKDGYFAREIILPEHFATHVDAPAHFTPGGWTLDQIPADRLVRPLVVLDVSAKTQHDSDYLVGIGDVADWENVNGHVPPGAVVMAFTGWDKHWNSATEYRNLDAKGVRHFPGYSLEAARFLVEGRGVVGLGIDTLSIDPGPSSDFPVHHYTLSHSVYHVENVANLSQVPASGSLVVVAPAKLEGASGGPARVLALAR